MSETIHYRETEQQENEYKPYTAEEFREKHVLPWIRAFVFGNTREVFARMAAETTEQEGILLNAQTKEFIRDANEAADRELERQTTQQTSPEKTTAGDTLPDRLEKIRGRIPPLLYEFLRGKIGANGELHHSNFLKKFIHSITNRLWESGENQETFGELIHAVELVERNIQSFKELSKLDALIKFKNRHGFAERLSNLMRKRERPGGENKEHKREKTKLVFLQYDIDFFTAFNDLGHDFGDLALKRLAITSLKLKDTLWEQFKPDKFRNIDSKDLILQNEEQSMKSSFTIDFMRWGGEEFVTPMEIPEEMKVPNNIDKNDTNKDPAHLLREKIAVIFQQEIGKTFKQLFQEVNEKQRDDHFMQRTLNKHLIEKRKSEFNAKWYHHDDKKLRDQALKISGEMIEKAQHQGIKDDILERYIDYYLSDQTHGPKSAQELFKQIHDCSTFVNQRKAAVLAINNLEKNKGLHESEVQELIQSLVSLQQRNFPKYEPKLPHLIAGFTQEEWNIYTKIMDVEGKFLEEGGEKSNAEICKEKILSLLEKKGSLTAEQLEEIDRAFNQENIKNPDDPLKILLHFTARYLFGKEQRAVSQDAHKNMYTDGYRNILRDAERLFPDGFFKDDTSPAFLLKSIYEKFKHAEAAHRLLNEPDKHYQQVLDEARNIWGEKMFPTGSAPESLQEKLLDVQQAIQGQLPKLSNMRNKLELEIGTLSLVATSVNFNKRLDHIPRHLNKQMIYEYKHASFEQDDERSTLVRDIMNRGTIASLDLPPDTIIEDLLSKRQARFKALRGNKAEPSEKLHTIISAECKGKTIGDISSVIFGVFEGRNNNISIQQFREYLTAFEFAISEHNAQRILDKREELLRDNKNLYLSGAANSITNQKIEELLKLQGYRGKELQNQLEKIKDEYARSLAHKDAVKDLGILPVRKSIQILSQIMQKIDNTRAYEMIDRFFSVVEDSKKRGLKKLVSADKEFDMSAIDLNPHYSVPDELLENYYEMQDSTKQLVKQRKNEPHGDFPFLDSLLREVEHMLNECFEKFAGIKNMPPELNGLADFVRTQYLEKAKNSIAAYVALYLTDQLTGSYNKAASQRIGATWLGKATAFRLAKLEKMDTNQMNSEREGREARYGFTDITVSAFDGDRLKLLNDAISHKVGDMWLQSTSLFFYDRALARYHELYTRWHNNYLALLHQNYPQIPLHELKLIHPKLFRMGGEEGGIILPGISSMDSQKLLDDLGVLMDEYLIEKIQLDTLRDHMAPAVPRIYGVQDDTLQRQYAQEAGRFTSGAASLSDIVTIMNEYNTYSDEKIDVARALISVGSNIGILFQFADFLSDATKKHIGRGRSTNVEAALQAHRMHYGAQSTEYRNVVTAMKKQLLPKNSSYYDNNENFLQQKEGLLYGAHVEGSAQKQ